MDAIKDFVSELLYYCSASNEKSRGFYIFVTIMLAVLTIACVAMVVLNIFMLIKGWWNVLYLILLLVAVVLEGATIWKLKNS